MKTYDFIFSNQLSYRIPRHAIFWFLWFIFFFLTVHIPGMSFFSNWHLDQSEYAKAYTAKRGGVLHQLTIMAWRQSWILLSHIAFTYVFIYFILPRYYTKRKKWVTTTGMLLLIFIAYLAFCFFAELLTALHVRKLNARNGLPHPPFNLWQWTRFSNVFFSTTFNLFTAVGIVVAIKLMKRWWLKQRETAQVSKEKAGAELQLLKAQVHPHFLFNSLNNIYSFALEGSPKAPEMIQKLSGLLHYMLYDCKQPLVPLEKELKLLNDYISLEKIRYGDRLKIDLRLPHQTNGELIAPLLLIPFVENSFKHGTSKMLAHPYVALNISIADGILYFKLTNSKPTGIEEVSVNGNRGLGLKNVRKRLELLYAGKHELQIADEYSEFGIWLKIALQERREGKIEESSKAETQSYELA